MILECMGKWPEKATVNRTAQEYSLNWKKISDFYKVIWSDDESKFNLFGSDGRVYVRRRVGEDFLPECVERTVKFGGGML